MWEVKVTIKWSTMTLKTWEETNEDGEMETGTEEVWSKEETIADLKVRLETTDDNVENYDKVYEEIEKWQNRTGLVDDESTEIYTYWDLEKAKKVK